MDILSDGARVCWTQQKYSQSSWNLQAIREDKGGKRNYKRDKCHERGKRKVLGIGWVWEANVAREDFDEEMFKQGPEGWAEGGAGEKVF